MSWQDQGRQAHGWFGNGTSGRVSPAVSGGMFGSGGTASRSEAAARGAIGALPASLRGRVASQYASGGLARLTAALGAWSVGAKLAPADFGRIFFGDQHSEAVVSALRSAAVAISTARDHADLRAAAEHLADAMQRVGLNRWPRFLVEVEAHARAPATAAAIQSASRPAGGDAAPRSPILRVSAEGKTEDQEEEERDGPQPLAPLRSGAPRPSEPEWPPVVKPPLPIMAKDAGSDGGRGSSAASGTQPGAGVAPGSADPVLNLLMPGGVPIGVRKPGIRPNVRTVDPEQFEELKRKLLSLGVPDSSDPRYKGRWYRLPDGGRFGVRTSKRSGETLDFDHPQLGPKFKVHR